MANKVIVRRIAGEMARGKLKKLNEKIDTTRQMVFNMRHYWEKRCKERYTLGKSPKHLKNLLGQVERARGLINKVYRRKIGFVQDNKRYLNESTGQYIPVYMTRNQVARLGNFMEHSFLKLRSFRKYKGGRVMFFKPKAAARLRLLLNNVFLRIDRKVKGKVTIRLNRRQYFKLKYILRKEGRWKR